MADSVKVIIEALLKDKRYIKSVKGIAKETKKTAKKSESAIKKIRAGWLLAAGGVFLAVRAFKAIFSATERQQRAENQLNAVLKSTGSIAGLTAKEIIKMAESLQKVTTFGDEAILEGQNLLLTFKKIGEDVFPRATETMLDVAQAMGQDMKTTAIQLGKALNDPIEGLTALRRVGITFEKQQEENIKAMVKMGDIAGAQVKILDELESQFGGSARAAVKGVGVWKQVANAWGDMLERGGKLIGAFDFLAKGLVSLFSSSEDIEDVTQNLIKSQAEYAEVIRKLNDEEKKLIGTERDLVEIRKAQLELQIAEQIKRVNEEYEEQIKVIDKSTKKQEKINEAYKELLGILPKATEEFTVMSQSAAGLLGVFNPFRDKIDEQGRFVVKTSAAIEAWTGAVERHRSAIKIATEENVKMNSSIDSIALSILEGQIPAETALLGLKQGLVDKVNERLQQLPAEIDAAKVISDQAKQDESDKVIADEADKVRVADKKARDDKALEDEKQRTAEKEKLIKEILALEISSEKKITKFTIKQLNARLKADIATTNARKKISQTFIDSFVGGIKDMGSSSADVFASTMSAFTDLIVGQIKTQAKIWGIQILAGRVDLIPAFAGAIAAASAVKALGNSAAQNIKKGGFQSGTEFVPSTGTALIHKGERIIPERLNIPGVSNEALINAAMSGLSIPSPAGGSNVSNSSVNNEGDTITNTFNNTMDDLTLEKLQEVEEKLNVRILTRN